MKYSNHLSPETYLAHKEYFDQGLIQCLERQKELNVSLKEKLEIRTARSKADARIIKSLILKLRGIETTVCVLKKQNADSQTELDKLKSEIKQISNAVTLEIEKRDKRIEDLLKIIQDQNDELNDLKRKDRKRKMSDTMNTNNPSSTYRFDDAVKQKGKAPVNSRKETERSRGGQKGHASTRSSLSSHCDKVIEIHVKAAPSGAQPVYDESGRIKYYCAQVKDARYVTEIREYHFVVSDDGITLRADMMNRFRINPLVYSDYLKSQVLYLQSKGVVSLGRLCQILNELSNGKLSLTESTVVNWMREFEERSRDYRAYAIEQIINTWIVHVDETGYRINGMQSWLHVLCTPQFAYFVMTQKRKDAETGPLKLLEGFSNVLCHDHFKPYYTLLNCEHSECNAHIERYLKAGVDFDEIEGCAEMLRLLHRSLKRKNELIAEGRNEMDKSEYEGIKGEYLAIIDKAIGQYKQEHEETPAKYVPDGIKTLKRMKEYVDEHLLFLRDFDVTYTNNAAEWQCRTVKAHKKISGQCYSIDTASYLTSLLTVIQSANLQKANILELMTALMNGRWQRPTESTEHARA